MQIDYFAGQFLFKAAFCFLMKYLFVLLCTSLCVDMIFQLSIRAHHSLLTDHLHPHLLLLHFFLIHAKDRVCVCVLFPSIRVNVIRGVLVGV